MIFKRIKFNNYRCFVNGEITFRQEEDRNINLIVGSNGAGKTEVLFAFWWVLYGFDFSKLKNKEDTPYSLNSAKYKSIVDGVKQTDECSVIVEFEHEGTTYIVERKEEYRKNSKSIVSDTYQSVSYYKSNHEMSLPIRDEKEVNELLARIIPNSILHGIIFDGERMKQLSSVDENAVKAIKGVINDITNINLVEYCVLCYQELLRDNNKLAKQLARQSGQNTLEDAIEEIMNLEGKLEDLRKRRDKIAEELNSERTKCKDLSMHLEGIKEVKKLEALRKEARQQIEKEEKNKEETLKGFVDDLKKGHLIICDPLFVMIEELITKYDVPAGLTVEAVNNILHRSKCICGNEWSEKMKRELENLKETLPPDNINSTIGEMVRQIKLSIPDIKSEISRDYNRLNQINEEINKQKGRVASYSEQILMSGSKEAEIIEKQYEESLKLSWSLEEETRINETEIQNTEKDLENRKRIKEFLSQYKDDAKQLEKRSKFIDKCLRALEEIKEINRKTALKKINELLGRAYSELCDDANYGRDLYIIQHNVDCKYQLKSFYTNQLNNTLEIMKSNGKYQELISQGLKEEEILEIAIISSSEANSTGQSKMNTLAFVKAILDYSNEAKNSETFEITKEYPLLIDAPFGDIFEKNLEKSAELLHKFAHQIVLMISKDSYYAISNQIAPYVSTVHTFEKVENHPVSKIHISSLEAL